MLLFLMISCARPFLKISPNLEKPNSAPTLLTTMYIEGNASRTQQEEELRVDINDVISQKDNLSLNETGAIFHKMTVDFFAQEGFAVFEDKERIEKDALIKGDDADQLKTVSQVLSGVWFSKGSSNMEINTNVILFQFNLDRIVKRFDSEVPEEYFLFASTRVYTNQHWLKQRPQLVVDYVLVSDKKELVMRARGVGYGESTFFVIDKSPENLGMALKEALESIETAERKPL